MLLTDPSVSPASQVCSTPSNLTVACNIPSSASSPGPKLWDIKMFAYLAVPLLIGTVMMPLISGKLLRFVVKTYTRLVPWFPLAGTVGYRCGRPRGFRGLYDWYLKDMFRGHSSRLDDLFDIYCIPEEKAQNICYSFLVSNSRVRSCSPVRKYSHRNTLDRRLGDQLDDICSRLSFQIWASRVFYEATLGDRSEVDSRTPLICLQTKYAVCVRSREESKVGGDRQQTKGWRSLLFEHFIIARALTIVCLIKQ